MSFIDRSNSTLPETGVQQAPAISKPSENAIMGHFIFHLKSSEAKKIENILKTFSKEQLNFLASSTNISSQNQKIIKCITKEKKDRENKERVETSKQAVKSAVSKSKLGQQAAKAQLQKIQEVMNSEKVETLSKDDLIKQLQKLHQFKCEFGAHSPHIQEINELLGRTYSLLFHTLVPIKQRCDLFNDTRILEGIKQGDISYLKNIFPPTSIEDALAILEYLVTHHVFDEKDQSYKSELVDLAVVFKSAIESQNKTGTPLNIDFKILSTLDPSAAIARINKNKNDFIVKSTAQLKEILPLCTPEVAIALLKHNAQCCHNDSECFSFIFKLFEKEYNENRLSDEDFRACMKEVQPLFDTDRVLKYYDVKANTEGIFEEKNVEMLKNFLASLSPEIAITFLKNHRKQCQEIVSQSDKNASKQHLEYLDKIIDILEHLHAEVMTKFDHGETRPELFAQLNAVERLCAAVIEARKMTDQALGAAPQPPKVKLSETSKVFLEKKVVQGAQGPQEQVLERSVATDFTQRAKRGINETMFTRPESDVTSLKSQLAAKTMPKEERFFEGPDFRTAVEAFISKLVKDSVVQEQPDEQLQQSIIQISGLLFRQVIEEVWNDWRKGDDARLQSADTNQIADSILKRVNEKLSTDRELEDSSTAPLFTEDIRQRICAVLKACLSSEERQLHTIFAAQYRSPPTT